MIDLSQTPDRAPLVALVTLGCAKNEVDSNRMSTILSCAGFRVTSCSMTQDPHEQDPSAIIVNTCSFLTLATQEGINLVLELAGARADKPVPIIMTGCIPSRYETAELTELLPEVAVFIRAQDEDEIVSCVSSVLGVTPLPIKGNVVKRSVEASFAYVKISEGCNRTCAFCAIPAIRGKYHSRDPREILSEVRHLVEGGVREIILIGQDTGVWGYDIKPDDYQIKRLTLSWLIKEVARIVSAVDGWVRVLYLQPEGMDETLIATLRDTPHVLHYIDMPIQHASKAMLKSMNRYGDSGYLRGVFAHLREEIPDMVLRTTVIAGYPGEKDEHVDELVDLMGEVEFDYCGVFTYSQEDGTPAAELPHQIDDDTKVERAQIIRDTADLIGHQKAYEWVGTTQRVLVDGYEINEDGERELYGRAWFQSPDDLDGVVHLRGIDSPVGSFVDVVIEDAVCYDLFAAPVGVTDVEPAAGVLPLEKE